MSDRAIQTAVQKIAGTFKRDTVSLLDCEVVSVDENKATCVVKTVSGDSSIEIPDVLLQGAICDGLLIIPTVGSSVKVLQSIYTNPFVVLYSDIDKFYLQVGDSSMTFFDKKQSDGSIINLNDGSFKGLVKVDELVKKLNALEDDLNKYKQALQTLLTTTVNEPGNGLPSAFQIALNAGLSSYYSQQFIDTKADDLQNKEITHGKV